MTEKQIDVIPRYVKFPTYAEVSGCSKIEYQDHLCWCIDEKTIVNYTLLVEHNSNLSCGDLVTKLE